MVLKVKQINQFCRYKTNTSRFKWSIKAIISSEFWLCKTKKESTLFAASWSYQRDAEEVVYVDVSAVSKQSESCSWYVPPIDCMFIIPSQKSVLSTTTFTSKWAVSLKSISKIIFSNLSHIGALCQRPMRFGDANNCTVKRNKRLVKIVLFIIIYCLSHVPSAGS